MRNKVLEALATEDGENLTLLLEDLRGTYAAIYLLEAMIKEDITAEEVLHILAGAK